MSRIAAESHRFALAHAVACLHKGFGKMGVTGFKSVVVGDDYKPPVARPFETGAQHRTFKRTLHGVTDRHAEIHAPVHSAELGAVAESGSDFATWMIVGSGFQWCAGC